MPFPILFIAFICGMGFVLFCSAVISGRDALGARFWKWCGTHSFEVMAFSASSIAFLNYYIKDHVITKYILMCAIIYLAVAARRVAGSIPAFFSKNTICRKKL